MRFGIPLLLGLAGCGARTGLEVTALDAPAPDAARGPDAAPTPAEPRVAFCLFDGLGGVGVYEVSVDGSGLRRVALPTARAVHPSFARDGRSMLYVALGAEDADPATIVVMDLQTRARRTLLTAPVLSSLAVSPDGRTVAYTAGLDLRAVGWDGAGDRLLVRGPYVIGSYSWGYGRPTFGADARAVFYSTAGRVERIGVDGARRETVLTENLRRIVFPNTTTSPDGTRIAAGVACGDDRALRTYAIASLPAACDAGERVTAIEPSAFGNQSNNPAWGESGQIVYQQARDLFVVDARGGAARNLTAEISRRMGGTGYAAFPVWVPRGIALP